MPVENLEGGYAYVPALPFASAGVVALPGMSLVRAVFAEPRPLRAAFAAVERHLESAHRPLMALCGFEFRMPKVLSVEGFVAFNARYVAQLKTWDLVADAPPTLSRTNVVPRGTALSEDAVYAFSYTIQEREDSQTFVISGAPELIPGESSSDFRILRRGESSEEALREKTRCVVSNVRRVIDALGASWDAACSVHLYSRWPLERELRRAISAEPGGVTPAHGIVCHDADPPVLDLELEVDVRRYRRELMLT
jgi:enamine deaminase RidA (YjgF/YER057c/UK114 family)